MNKGLVVDAEILAAFANLGPSDADKFRNEVARDFVPEGFWAGLAHSMQPGATAGRIWHVEQQRLRDAWRSQFSPERCIDLIASAAKLSEREQWLEQTTEQVLIMPNEQIPGFLAKQSVPKPRIWPYQHAVMLLALQPWRARICGKCGMYFVKKKPRDRYCSKACSKRAVLDSKNKSWGLHGKNWRPSKLSKNSRKMRGK
jgi:hypothetical protein